MSEFLKWIRKFGLFVWVQNMNVLVTDGKTMPAARSNGPLLLEGPARPAAPRMVVRLISDRRERPSDVLARVDAARIADSWRRALGR